MNEADAFRAAIVSMLNIMGDRSEPCPGAKCACPGCEYESSEAMRRGLTALGYSTWVEFHTAEILERK